MSVNNFNDIIDMHAKYDFAHGGEPRLLGIRDFRFRHDFMKEELKEFHTAHVSGDLAGAADALIDLVVVAMGTGVMMGLPWQLLWDDVHRANMTKVRGVTDRGVDNDLVKPEGWHPPRTAEVLAAFRQFRHALLHHYTEERLLETSAKALLNPGFLVQRVDAREADAS